MEDVRCLRESRNPRGLRLRHPLLALAACVLAPGCASSPTSPDGGVGVDAPSTEGAVDAPAKKDTSRAATSLVISVANPTPRTTSLGINYWRWMPDFGDAVSGTADLIKALKPAYLRVGGYNNDVNFANPFDEAAFDKAVAYARAIGAEPIIQVPVLADNTGQPPTPATAAAMVRYANVTKGYGIRYFSIGNEPDLYATQGLRLNPTLPALPGYTAADYCTTVESYVAAMKAVDPTLRIVGPDLSWKYQIGNGQNDWLTPILTGCGNAFDIIAIHRYPFSATQAKLSSAAGDGPSYRNLLNQMSKLLQTTGLAHKPLALTEMNVVYDKTWCTLDASPGTVGSALWLADSLGISMEQGLLTSAIWAIGDTDDFAMGLVGPAPGFVPRPAYHTYSLYADHFGPTLVQVSAPAGISAHASRKASNDATQIIVINWSASSVKVPIEIAGLTVAPPSVTVTLPGTSMAAVEISDSGVAQTWVYGEAQRAAGLGPQPLTSQPGLVVDAGLPVDGGGAGMAVGSGCDPTRPPDAAIIHMADASAATSCNLVPPEATGNLTVAGGYITANNLHGYGGSWAWKGRSSAATLCATPLCNTADGFGFLAVDTYGGAPLSDQPVSCEPALLPTALCVAGSMTRDPTYYSMVGIGLNVNQDAASGAVQELAIHESITVTTELVGQAKGNPALRLQLVDMEGNFYCVEAGAWKSGVPTPIRHFRKQCWDPSVPNAEAPVGTKARHFDVFLPGGLSDQDFSFCVLDISAK